MNKNEAINLIKDTFETSFSKDRFIIFTKNLLNTFDESKAFHAHGYVLEIYKDHVKTYERLGTYTDPDGKKIDILIVYLQKESSIERARTAQRNFIAQYLKDRGEKDAGLIAFVSPNLNDWRFSFVKMEYKFEKTDKGYIKAKEKFTPSKRYSYLVGPHEASHTAQSRMYPVILNDQINPTLEEIEAIFSVEKVTKEFFEEYKRLFLNLADEFSKNSEFKTKVVETNKVQVADFVKKLMGQIVFLYFLQKKGWLGVKPGEKWGTGDKRFMHNLFDKQYCDYQNFYNDVLEPLFYDTLNNRDRKNSVVINDQSYSPYFKCRIPYLNGGLFTPVYEWDKTKIFIDNKYYKDIFDVFDTFNFTVYESDPIEKEVAVDPEMLGKVFENLLEIRDRKSKGAFYTPREIVHYMCQESLINYLISQSGFPEERIRNLMKAKNQEIARTIKDKEKIENLPDLNEIAAKVNDLLKIVKVCDPAVGSGAFPMGLLKEISTTRYFLNKHFIKETNRNNNLLTEYDIKKVTLENCIYGVDIDPGAVEIARLRFWLSLVVEHEIEDIEPLPNLDYKIMQGNSLIELLSPTLLTKTNDDNRNKLIDNLTNAKNEYFNLSDSLEKAKKREEINLLTRHIINYDKEKQRDTIWERIKDMRSQMGLFGNQKQQEQLNIGDVSSKEISKELKELSNIENVSKTEHFEWHLNFNEVFEKGGFDIVIANPPWVFTRSGDFAKNLKRDITKIYLDSLVGSQTGHAKQSGKINLYAIFILLSLKILKENGTMTFITPNTLLRATIFDAIRKKLLDDSSILLISDLSKGIFENVTASTIIFMLQNIAPSLDHYVELTQSIPNNSFYKKWKIKQNKFLRNISFGFNMYSDDKSNSILEKIKRVSNRLDTYFDVVGGGIATGPEKNKYISNKKLSEQYKPLIEGKDVKRYEIVFHNKYILYDKRKLYRAREESIFLRSEKLVTQRIGGGLYPLIVGYDNKKYYTFNSTNSILYKDNNFLLNIKYLLSLLNSKLLNWYFKIQFTNKSELTVNISKTFLEQLPIKLVNSIEQKPFIEITDKILQINQKDKFSRNDNDNLQVNNYINIIDQMIYKLYELTPDEIQIVEKQNG